MLYDKFGVAQQEATGSGFWAVEPAVSVLYPSDPVVLFASIGYIESIPKDVNKAIEPKVVVVPPPVFVMPSVINWSWLFETTLAPTAGLEATPPSG